MAQMSTKSKTAFFVALGAATLFNADGVHAVGSSVKFACARDYLAHCRAHKPDSADARRCMNGVGAKLSARCVNALVAAGEVSVAEVKRRAASVGN